MFLLGSSNSEGKYSVLFEISSASVAATVFVREAGTVHMLWNKRIEYGYQTENDYVRYVRSMYAALLEVGMQVTSDGFKKVREVSPDFTTRGMQVYCVLAPPWFFGAVETESVIKEKAFQVTPEVLAKVRKDGFNKVLETEDCLRWEDFMGEPNLLEYHTDIFTVEGYRVPTVHHISTTDLFVQSYYSIISESIQAHITEVIERVFPNHQIEYISSTKLLSGLHVYFKESDASHRVIFAEIKGEITSIILLKNGIVENILNIPYGTNHVLRKVAPKAISVQESQDALSVLLKNGIENSNFSAFPEQLQQAMMEWHSYVEGSLRKLTGGFAPPTDMILFVNEMWGALYEKVLTVPMKLPGVRESVKFETYTIESIQKQVKDLYSDDSIENGAKVDMCLLLYAQLLSHKTN